LKYSHIQACQKLLGLLIDSDVLSALLKGSYFTLSEYKMITELTLEYYKESNFAQLIETFEPDIDPSKRSNQLLDKFLALVPLLHVEILKSNSSWIANNLNFIMQSAASDYLSRTSMPTFSAIKKVIEPKSPEEKNFERLSVAQFEIANLKLESKVNSKSETIESLEVIKRRFEESHLEAEILTHYNFLIKHFNKSASLSLELAEEANDYYSKYSYLLTKTVNVKVFFFVSRIGILHALLIPDYMLLAKRCVATIDGLENKFDVVNTTYIRVTRNRLIEAYIQIGNYIEAISELNKIGKLPNMASKARQSHLRILIYLRSNQHLEAAALFKEIDTPYIRKILTGGLKYNFDLVRNLIYIIAALKDLDPIYLPVKRTLKTMLNVDSEYYKDKSGLNIAQLVTKWVLLVMNRDTDTMEAREMALEKYLARHVRDKKNYRAKCMLRMLKVIYKSNYNVEVIKKRSSISYNRLKRTKPDGTFQAMELEIISYEQLWQMLLDYLAAGKKMYA